MILTTNMVINLITIFFYLFFVVYECLKCSTKQCLSTMKESLILHMPTKLCSPKKHSTKKLLYQNSFHGLMNRHRYKLNIYFIIINYFTVPATNDDLPDMYETLEGLDTDEIDLNLKTSPPSILTNDQQQEYQKEVQSLKQGMFTIARIKLNFNNYIFSFLNCRKHNHGVSISTWHILQKFLTSFVNLTHLQVFQSRQKHHLM